MRVALFGGTFDPVHRGHLAIAAAAVNAFRLDRVLFAPTGRQPLKADPPAASFSDRLEMVRLALTDGEDTPLDPRCLPSDEDAPTADGEPNFTVDLLAAMRRQRPQDDLLVLAGADSFLTLQQWRDPARLLALAEWIVVSRPGSSLTDEELQTLKLTEAQRARVHLLTNLHEEVSATELRRRLADGDPCPELLPARVADYIQARRLYRSPPTPPTGPS